MMSAGVGAEYPESGIGTRKRRLRRILLRLLPFCVSIAMLNVLQPSTASAKTQSVTPIKHVVVLFMENHSFDETLGGICVEDHLGCDAAASGKLANGKTIRLAAATDLIPNIGHGTTDQVAAMDRGKMDGFSRIKGCTAADKYKCYSQYHGKKIPNLRQLADHYAISDRTFSSDPVPTWGGHIDLIAGQTDGFVGEQPKPSAGQVPGPGWGCDSGMDAPWSPNPGAAHPTVMMEPACVPRADGFGPYRASPVKHIPTILDRLDGAGLSWKLYSRGSSGTGDSGYLWSICPTFADCIYDQANDNQPNPNWVERSQFMTDAAAGKLPTYSAVMPEAHHSQHNLTSMLIGDNYIASVVGAVMHGPSAQWRSTVIFLTYDDCGCFYDHVAPPPKSGLGVRVPMLIISPKAKARYVDHTSASFDSMLSFVEHNWSLKPLYSGDAHAYDYCRAFVFTTLPCTGAAAGTHNTTAKSAPLKVPLVSTPLPSSSRYLLSTPVDPDDPT